MKSKSFFILSLVIFRFILDLSYLLFVSELFLYVGFALDFGIQKYILSFIIFFLVSLFLNKDLNKPSDFFMCVFFIFVITPLTSIYGFSDLSLMPLLQSVIAFFIVSYCLKLRIPIILPPIFKHGRFFVAAFSLLATSLLIIWFFISGAVNNFNLDFQRVYEFRADSSRMINIGVLAYLNQWVLKVFYIFLLTFSLYKKKFIVSFILVLLSIFFFGVTGHKSILFQPFLILVIYFYFKNNKNLSIIPRALTLAIFFSMIPFLFFADITISSLFVRRIFYVPALLTYQYYEYFSINDFIYWGNSVLSPIINYEYDVSISKIIGLYNGSGDNANVGFIGSGYAHAGFFGVVFYSLLLGIIIRMIDMLTQSYPVWFGIAVSVNLIRSAMVSSDLFITLLTHGLIIALIMLVIIRKPNIYSCSDKKYKNNSFA